MKKIVLVIIVVFLSFMIISCDEKPQTETDKQKVEVNDLSEFTIPKEKLNIIVDVDGKQIIQNPDNDMVLVNKTFSLPDNYYPSDLVIPNVLFSYGKQDVEKSYLRKVAADALEIMFTEAVHSNIELVAVSGFRSYERQRTLFENEVKANGKEEAEKVVAIPGYSEHQTGLAMDISSALNSFSLSESFEDTPEGTWLRENAHKYGFIMRYPKGMEVQTGYAYEPWHFRYVGIEAATEMYNRNLTFEEYIKNAKAV